jgi:hypothetical protein
LRPIKPLRALAAAVLCLLAGCGGKPPRPNLSGNWTLAPEKCSFQIPAPVSSTLSIEDRSPQFSLRRTTVFGDADYRAAALALGYNWNVALVADGKTIWEKLPGGVTRVFTLEWQGNDLVLSLTMAAGNGAMEESVSRYRLSPDGRSITVTEHLGRLENRWVYEKQ